MVRLTVDLAAKCAKYTNPLKEREVDLRGNRIPEIENLGILEDGFDSIDLSDNDIATLGNFPLMKRCKTLIIHTNRVQRMAGGLGTYLPNLENLVLNSNRLRELEDLAPLADLPSLQRLTLLDNLVSKHPDYRPYVIARLPALKHLDFKKVKPVERERALKQFGRPVKSHAGAAAVASSSAPPGPRDMTDAERKEIADLIASAKSLDEIKKIEEERLPPVH
ncbi:U2 small nuclear ribonucleoprotein Aprime [Diplonema papillatum]|nr:U2 small nuclear ribonucleoprotein Aprime [Diplonema papillatum]WGM49952.1 U2A' [Diplonema papillatum]